MSVSSRATTGLARSDRSWIATAFFAAVSIASAAPSYERDVIPLLKKYCFECHDANVHDLAFDEYKTVANVLKARKHFDSALRNSS
jgi:hypothetical protein